MKLITLIFAAAAALAAQTVSAAPSLSLKLVGSQPYVGQQATLELDCTGCGQLAILQFAVTLPPELKLPLWSLSPNQPSKTLTCTVDRCIVYGGVSVLNDGPLASLSVTVTAAASLPLSGLLLGSQPTAVSAVALVPGTPPVSITPKPWPCDVNLDGKFDSADILAAIVIVDAAYKTDQALVLLGQPRATCSVLDINGDGHCDVLDLQRAISAAASNACNTAP
jgi:hypothetical protein